MAEGAARTYLRDLPDAELHLLDAGHWALETNLDEIVALARDFLGRVHGWFNVVSKSPRSARVRRIGGCVGNVQVAPGRSRSQFPPPGGSRPSTTTDGAAGKKDRSPCRFCGPSFDE